MLPWLRRLMTPRRANLIQPSPTQFAHLRLEVLEDRCLPLDSLCGMALAPMVFGQFSNDMLVGHFDCGQINALNPTADAILGAPTLSNGQPVEEGNLWVPTPDNDRISSADTLYLMSGINEEKPSHLGSLSAVQTFPPNNLVFADLSWICADGDT